MLTLSWGSKRIDTYGFYPLGTPVSFYLLAWRRPETGDRFEIGERQSGYSSVFFVKYSQFTDSVLLHIPATLRRRDIPVSRNSFVCDYGRHLRITIIVGCDDSAHRIYLVCTIYPVGAAIGRPRNGKLSRQFSYNNN